jgi:hypothetical protein
MGMSYNELKHLTQTPQIMENVLYVEAFPIKPFDILLESGKRPEKLKSDQATQIYYQDKLHQKLLPLTVQLKRGIKRASLISPYQNAVVADAQQKRYESSGIQALKQSLQQVPEKEDFVAIVELDAKKAIFEATYIMERPNYLFDLVRQRLVKTAHTVNLPTLKDPIVRVGNRFYGRLDNVTISDFTGSLNLYGIQQVTKIPSETKTGTQVQRKELM